MSKKVLFGIKGSKKFPEDIIKILEEFGGKNTQKIAGNYEHLIYYVDQLPYNSEHAIKIMEPPFGGEIYELDKLFSIIKYHVGDLIKIKGRPALYKIMELKWEDFKIFYKVDDEWFEENQLIPTNEDSSPDFEEKDNEKFLYHEGEWVTITENGIQVKEGNISEFLIDKVVKDSETGEIKYLVNGKLYPPRQISRVHVHLQEEFSIEEKSDKAKAPVLYGEDYSGKRIAYKIPKGYEFDKVEDGEIIFKEQLPKIPETYEESCEILGIPPINLYTGLSTGIALSYIQRMDILNQLYICRDAFWKTLCGPNPWTPPEDEENISTLWITDSVVFKFPTGWHMDKFYKNFKSLIDKLDENKY